MVLITTALFHSLKQTAVIWLVVSMAVTIAFGLGFATILTIVVVPMLSVIIFSVKAT